MPSSQSPPLYICTRSRVRAFAITSLCVGLCRLCMRSVVDSCIRPKRARAESPCRAPASARTQMDQRAKHHSNTSINVGEACRKNGPRPDCACRVFTRSASITITKHLSVPRTLRDECCGSYRLVLQGFGVSVMQRETPLVCAVQLLCSFSDTTRAFR